MTHSETEIVNNWDHAIEVEKGDNLYQLLKVIGLENRRLGLDIEELYENRFLENATGKELEKLGDYVGVVRKTGESDKKLRHRIRSAFLAQASGATYEDFVKTMFSILQTTKETVEVVTPPETSPKVVELNIDGSVLDEHVLTVSELATLLSESVSADGRVDIVEQGTFAFDSQENDGLEGWDEGTWSSTVK